MTDVFTESEGDGIESGAYNATLVQIERKASKTEPDKEFRIWRFKTPEGVELSGTSSLAAGPLSKTVRWATAILGHAPTPGEPIGTLYGKPCIVAVETNDQGFAKVIEVHPAVVKTAKPVSKPIPTSTVTNGPETVTWDAEALAEEALPF